MPSIYPLSFDCKKRLPQLHESPVFDKDFGEATHDIRLDLVEQLHRLNHSKALSDFDLGPHFNKRRGVRRSRAIERSDHRRLEYASGRRERLWLARGSGYFTLTGGEREATGTTALPPGSFDSLRFERLRPAALDKTNR